ncbi:MAG: hypothetical protein HY744_22920 [Deltaproteobacteria bacterium]|nr:hypothetical protein [Deltaproteobacteria bacterium]
MRQALLRHTPRTLATALALVLGAGPVFADVAPSPGKGRCAVVAAGVGAATGHGALWALALLGLAGLGLWRRRGPR